MRLMQFGINLWLIQTSEHAASSESLDGTKTDDVSEACGSKQRGMAHATEKGCVGKLCALIGVFDGRLADANGDDIAHDHYQGHFRGPGEGGGSDGQKRGEHADP